MTLITQVVRWFAPIFQQVGNLIQYKRFPADYMWRDFIDFTDFANALVALGEAVTQAMSAPASDFAMFADEANGVPNAVQYTNSNTYRYGHIGYQTAANDGMIWQRSGLYVDGGTFYLLHTKASNGGQSKLFISGVEIGQINFYNAATIDNQLAVITLNSGVIENGRHQVTLQNFAVGTGGGRAQNCGKLWFKGSGAPL